MISRATARGSPSRARLTSMGTSRLRRTDPLIPSPPPATGTVAAPPSRSWHATSCLGTRMIRASPWPPPPQSAAAPVPPPRRRSSSARVRTSRAPDIPIGWPSAIAPPLTLTMSWLTPRSRMDWMATAAKASLISIRSRSARVRPALSSACRIALAGCECSELSGPGDVAVRPDLGEPGQPELLGLGPAHHHHRAGAVGDRRRAAGRDGAVRRERRPQLGQGLGRGVRPDPLILADHDGVALALRDRHRGDLFGEEPVLLRRGGPLVAGRGEGVLLLAGDAARRRRAARWTRPSSSSPRRR